MGRRRRRPAFHTGILWTFAAFMVVALVGPPDHLKPLAG